MQYHRPGNLKQALDLLKTAAPLGGGTALTPQRESLSGVVDLQDLDLAGIRLRDGSLRLGGFARLQALLQADQPIPQSLKATLRLEAAANIRNQATLAGAIMSADGRSPLTIALLSLGAQVQILPGERVEPLDSLLDARAERLQGGLIQTVLIDPPVASGYLQVARSPVDFPIVGAAVARWADPDGETALRIALGGYGPHPIRVTAAEAALAGFSAGAAGDEQARLAAIQAAGAAAGQAYAGAGDVWASAEYRQEVAAVLVGRLLQELLG